MYGQDRAFQKKSIDLGTRMIFKCSNIIFVKRFTSRHYSVQNRKSNGGLKGRDQ